LRTADRAGDALQAASGDPDPALLPRAQDEIFNTLLPESIA
jgi:hypothetical protein